MAACVNTNTFSSHESPDLNSRTASGSTNLFATPGSLAGLPVVDDVADDDCFSIELDVNHHSFGDEDGDVNLVLDLLVSDSPDSQLEGLDITERSLETEAWLSTFIRSDGVALCVELWGCFSPAEVQRSAANVCSQIASSSPRACEVLLRADVGSMIEQHIKKPETTLCMFEDALYVVAAIARQPGMSARAFDRRHLMPHLVSILTDTSNAAAPARSAALAAITALCSSWPAARDDFFHCGGASTVLHTLLQPERGPVEARASVELLSTVAAASEECREIMSENGVMGIEVLVQVHRDAEARGDSTLSCVAAQTVAVLTHKHPLNMATLENRTKLLGDEALVWKVLALHSQLFVAAPMSPTTSKSQPIPASLSTVSTSTSDVLDSAGLALTSPGPASRKHSLDSSRALIRMGSSVKSMLGWFIRKEKNVSDEGTVRGRSSESVSAAGSVPSWPGLSVV